MSINEYSYPSNVNDSVNDPDKTKRILIAAGGFLMLVLLLVAAFLVLFSSPSTRSDYAKAAAAQNEVIRIADLGLDNDQTTRSNLNIAANVKAVSTNNLNILTGIVSSNFENPLTRSSLNSATSANVTQALSEAEAANNFNDVFIEILPLSIEEANAKVKIVFDAVESNAQKVQLSRIFEHNNALLDSIDPSRIDTSSEE